MITTVLFDLDGTLIHMDQDDFIKHYFQHIAMYFAKHGYDPVRFTKSMQVGVVAMMTNNGEKLNHEVFWKSFCEAFGEDMTKENAKFERFYETDFDAVKPYCGPKANSNELLQKLREMGLRLVLASNAVYPPIAYEKRMAWGGLTPEPFELLTTYENMHYCKPSLGYFKEVAEKLGVTPEECLMVGNDVSDDMPARHAGMQVFLLTDYLINPKNEDFSTLPQGNFDDLIRYIEKNK